MILAAATTIEDTVGNLENPLKFGDSVSDLGTLLTVGIRIFFIVGALAVVVYVLWGSFNWITSGGDKERIQKAQGKIRNALIGIMIMVLMISVFATIMQFVLGGNIIKWGDNGLEFNLPTLEKQCCTLRDCSSSPYPECAP